MDIVALNKDIQNKNLGCLYIFIGPEIGLQNVYINQILKQRPGGHEESVESVMDRLKSTTSFLQTPFFINNSRVSSANLPFGKATCILLFIIFCPDYVCAKTV